MSDIAIRVENLSKEYHIGKKQNSYKTLRDTLADAFIAPFRKARKLLKGYAIGATEMDETIWALKDVSFEVKKGEVVGIIGRNGAGKSTLLKILSRITEPTTGFAEVWGRVGSLLEVGTGFHPELSGRENVYLNGAILGMKRSEINRKFDEIVGFAEIEKFIDTPVKHYSSGMYLRLAFSVAAHLEPDILIVDEVLAVGDMRFQKKCLNKMQDVGQEGRTVLLVSHNMNAISRLCNRSLLIEEGKLQMDSQTSDVISRYMTHGIQTTTMKEWTDLHNAPGDDIVRLCAVRAKNTEFQIVETINIRQPINIELEYHVLKPGHILIPYFNVYNEHSILIFTTIDQDPAWKRLPRDVGRYKSSVSIPGNFFSEGQLFVCAAMSNAKQSHHFYQHNIISLHVFDSHDGNSARGDWSGKMGGIIRPLFAWNTQFNPTSESDQTRLYLLKDN